MSAAPTKESSLPRLNDESVGDDEQTQPRASLGATPELDTERALSIAVPEVDARATITIISGPGAGRIVAVNRHPFVLGRSSGADVKLEDPTVGRSHARVERDGDAYVLEDLGSVNGTLLNGNRVERAVLTSGDRVQLGPRTVLRFAVVDRLERDLLTNLVESSTCDRLTGVFNRAFFDNRLEVELAYARRHDTKVAVLLLDLDRFKKINDSHGHCAGDDVLRAVADAIRATLRTEDTLARYGGEEFAVLARAASHLDALRLADRVRIAVAQRPVAVADGTTVGVTVSIGVAHHTECGEPCTPAALVKLADRRLYWAKAAGRNGICANDRPEE